MFRKSKPNPKAPPEGMIKLRLIKVLVVPPGKDRT
jgi:hypothetical protein